MSDFYFVHMGIQRKNAAELTFTLTVKDTVGAGDAFYVIAGLYTAAGAPTELGSLYGKHCRGTRRKYRGKQRGDIMAKEATLQIRMDADLKEQAEELYRKLGTSFAEAVRIFARQSVQEKAMPFRICIAEQDTEKRIGIAKGEFSVPEDIDKYNDEIEDMFGGI